VVTGAFSVGEGQRSLGTPPSIMPMKLSNTRISTPITITTVRATARNSTIRREDACLMCYIIRVMSPRRTRDAANRRGYPTRKPLARKKIPADIRSLCRAYTDEGVRVLASIMRQPEHPPAARVQAAIALLDRGWGRVPQAHTGEDGEGDIRVTIRHIVQGGDSAPDAKVIDATPVRHENGDEG